MHTTLSAVPIRPMPPLPPVVAMPPFPWSLRLGRSRGGFLLVACRLEDVVQAVVAFVARVLVEIPFARPHVLFDRPRLRPRRRIVDGETVLDAVLARAREALDHVKRRARPAVVRLVAEVRGFDDERAALPM